MPYKLTYFDVRARAENSRMLFALAEQEYEDVRLNREKWAELKPNTPYGQLPMLEVDGHTICQSRAMERFLAKRFNFYGKDEFEQVRADMIIDCLEDFVKPLTNIFQAQSDEEKDKLKKKYAEETMVNSLPRLEKLVSSGGCFLGSQVMWVDICCFNAFTWPPILGIPFDFTKYPKLKGVVEKVETNPKIAAWIKKRPDNTM